MSLTRQTRNYFFSSPSGSAYHLFTTGNTPNETTFRKLFNSIGFIGASEDYSSTLQAGFIKIESDANVKTRTDNMGTGSPYAVQPYQLPNLEGSGGTEVISGGAVIQEGGLKMQAVDKAVGSKSRTNFRIELDLNNLTTESGVDPSNDLMVFIDATASYAARKYTITAVTTKAVGVKTSSFNIVPYDATILALVDFTGLTLKKDASRTISIANGTTVGNDLTVKSGAATSGVGGILYLQGGAGASGGAGGAAYLQGGAGATAGTGGAISIIGGSSASGTGGAVFIDGGNGATDGDVAIASQYGKVGIGGEAHATAILKVTGAMVVTSTVTISSVTHETTDVDKFLVVDSNGEIKYRTGAEVASDIA